MYDESEYNIGSVKLTHAASLVFSVKPWKGRLYAHIRKYVSGAKYEGPTKAGLTMECEVLVSVVEVLIRLKAEVPGVEEKQFDKIQKGSNTSIVVAIFPPDDLKALPSVDVREFVNSVEYTGPTKKGVRFPWNKLPEFINMLQTQVKRMSKSEKTQPTLFSNTFPDSENQIEKVGAQVKVSRDSVIYEILPDGPKDFPSDFISDQMKTINAELPSEPVSIAVLPDGGHVLRSSFGFLHKVRNPIEGNFLYYAHLRKHRIISIPIEMIDIFRVVKLYENYLRNLRHSLLQAYECKTHHRPTAEHKTKEIFMTYGLPWLD